MKIVGIGASVTAGTPGFFAARTPPAGEGNVESQYAYWMMQARPAWKVLNRGMRGQRTDQILLRFDYDVLDNRPDAVIIMAGTNDLYQGRNPSDAMANLETMYQKAAGAGIGVVACSIIPLNLANPVVKKIVDLNLLIEKSAAVRGIVFADIYRVMEDPRRPGFIKESPDDVHPDPAGYRKIGEALAAAVEKLGLGPR